jgi:hypothetical protein
MHTVRLLLAALLVTALAGGCTARTTILTDQDQIAQLAIAFVATPFTDDYGILRVPGYVDNNSDSNFRTVTLEIQLVDADGNKKERATYELQDIAPHNRKTFDLNLGTLPPDRTALVSITSLEVVE